MKSLLLFLVALGLAAEPLPKATPQEAGFSAEGGELGSYLWIDPKHELAAVYMV